MTIKHFLKIAIVFSSTTSKWMEERKETKIRTQYNRNIKNKVGKEKRRLLYDYKPLPTK